MFLAIMIDGGFLDSAKRTILGGDFRIQHDKLGDKILEEIRRIYDSASVTLIRVIYYDCYPYTDDEAVAKEVKAKKDGFFNYLKSLPRWDVRTGTVRPAELPLRITILNYDELDTVSKEALKSLRFSIQLKGRYERTFFSLSDSPEPVDITLTRYRQKGTDIQLCTDMLAMAQKNGASLIICLLSGDSDFVPVIEEVKRTGAQVVLAYFRQMPVSPELWRACDERLEISPEFLRSIMKAKEDEAC